MSEIDNTILLKIIRDTRTILHIINTRKFKLRLDAIEDNINRPNIRNHLIILKELENIHAKLQTIEPNPRHERRLFNIIGITKKRERK